MPYRKNDVSLITETLPANVELEQTVKTVVPYAWRDCQGELSGKRRRSHVDDLEPAKRPGGAVWRNGQR